MGCSRATWTSVTQGDALTRSNSQRRAATAKTAPKMLTFEMVLVLRWKICDIGRAIHGPRRRYVQTESLLRRRRRDLRSIARTQCVLREPGYLGVRLENLMAELLPLVTLARCNVEMRRHSVTLQRPIHLDGLLHRHAYVVFADEEQRRRLYVRC